MEGAILRIKQYALSLLLVFPLVRVEAVSEDEDAEDDV